MLSFRQALKKALVFPALFLCSQLTAEGPLALVGGESTSGTGPAAHQRHGAGPEVAAHARRGPDPHGADEPAAWHLAAGNGAADAGGGATLRVRAPDAVGL